jgi:hypothetical protein
MDGKFAPAWWSLHHEEHEEHEDGIGGSLAHPFVIFVLFVVKSGPVDDLPIDRDSAKRG